LSRPYITVKEDKSCLDKHFKKGKEWKFEDLLKVICLKIRKS